MHRIDTRAARVAVALAATAAALVLAAAWPAADADGRAADPLAFFHPFITLDLEEHRRLDRGGIVVRVLPGRDGEVGIYATHYRNASLGMTAILDDVDDGVSYLVYVNRSHVDVLGGLFGALKRTLVEGRLRSEGEAVLRVVRARLEGGDPEVGSWLAVPGAGGLP
jgi:hypothetical protein